MSTTPTKHIKLKMSITFGILELRLRTQDGRQISTQDFDLSDIEVETNGLLIEHLVDNLSEADKGYLIDFIKGEEEKI